MPTSLEARLQDAREAGHVEFDASCRLPPYEATDAFVCPNPVCGLLHARVDTEFYARFAELPPLRERTRIVTD